MNKLKVLFDAGGLWQFVPERFRMIMSQRFSCNFLDRGMSTDHARETLGKWADVIFVDWSLDWAQFYLEKFGDKRIIIRTHRADVWHENSPFYHWKNADAILFMNNVWRKKFIEEGRKYIWDDFENRCITVPRLVDQERWRFLSDDTSKRIYGRRLGILGRCIPRKRVLEFAKFLRDSLPSEYSESNDWTKAGRPTPNFTLSLLGFEERDRIHFPDYIAELESVVRSSHRIELLVHADSDRVVKWFADIDFIISYSDDESWHAAITEGMLCGCVPIVIHWPGAEEMHPDQYVVENDGELVDLLKTLSPPLEYKNGHGWLPKVQEKRMARSQQARTWSVYRYSLESVADLYADIILGKEVELDINPKDIIPRRKRDGT